MAPTPGWPLAPVPFTGLVDGDPPFVTPELDDDPEPAAPDPEAPDPDDPDHDLPDLLDGDEEDEHEYEEIDLSKIKIHDRKGVAE